MLNQTCLQKKAVGATWLGLDAYLLILPLVNIGGRMERWEMEKKGQTEQFNTAHSANMLR